MKNDLFFDFSVNKENNTIHVTRDFAANLSLVWDAWTKPEILDQWWAPKPWRAETGSMDFSEGGYWHYAMVGPEGEKHWAIFEYQSIQPQKSYAGMDAFADENRNLNKEMPRMHWANTFTGKGDTTTVTCEIKFNELADLEKIIEMGFKEGFTMGLQNLDEWLEKNRK